MPSPEKPHGAIIVIPAKNEEGFVADVVRPCVEAKKLGLVREVIVVDDYSSDRTGTAARKAGAVVVKTDKNDVQSVSGKGGAFLQGVTECHRRNAEIMLTFDADLLNLGVGHIKELIGKMADQRVRMAVMEVMEGSHIHAGAISGQRAFRVGAFNFLFLKGEQGRPLKSASRFLDLIRGYGLERGLNETFEKKGLVFLRPEQELRARPPFEQRLGLTQKMKKGRQWARQSDTKQAEQSNDMQTTMLKITARKIQALQRKKDLNAARARRRRG